MITTPWVSLMTNTRTAKGMSLMTTTEQQLMIKSLFSYYLLCYITSLSLYIYIYIYILYITIIIITIISYIAMSSTAARLRRATVSARIGEAAAVLTVYCTHAPAEGT